MKKIDIRVIFFNAILVAGLFFQNITYLKAVDNGYTQGTNTIYGEIVFDAVVEESIDINLSADDVNLDFGMMPKYSTGKFFAETKIEAKGAPLGSEITAKFVEGPQSTKELPLESDGYTKMQIKYKATDEGKKIDFSKDKYNTEENEKIDVYLEKINDKKYKFEDNLSETKAIVPIKGEIRDISNAKIGEYEGEVSVYLELVTPNKEVTRR